MYVIKLISKHININRRGSLRGIMLLGISFYKSSGFHIHNKTFVYNDSCITFMPSNFQKYLLLFHNYSLHNTLVRAECVRCPWLQAESKVATIFPFFSGVPLFKTPEGVVVGFRNFAWGPN